MTSLEITNSRICEFYNTHKCFNVESINLMMIDLLEKSILSSQPVASVTPTTAHNVFQINELHNSFGLLQDSITHINKSILSVFLQYKNEYLAEFKSIFDNQSKTEFTENNVRFIQKFQHLIFSYIPEAIFKSKYTQLYNKIVNTIQQFQHIINANVDTIFNKSDFQTIYNNYIQNFEINSGHLIQSIQQLFTEFLQSKYESVTKLTSDLNQQFSPATYTQYSKLNYELNDFTQNLKQYNSRFTCLFETMVSQLFPTATVQPQTTTQEYNSILLCRDHKHTIFISSIANKERNVNTQEVKDFIKDVQTNNCNGILISQHTGITSKPNYHIEIVNKNILIFI